VFVPMMLPPLVGGILLLVLYGPYGVIGMLSEQFGVGLVNSLAGIVLAQVFVASPYIVIASLSAFGAVDVTLEHAAATLGDYRWQIIRRVSLPLAWPGIAAGITLAWVRTLGEFGATLVMAYHPNTLPVFLWVQLTGEGLRGALPLALLLLVIGAGTMAMVYRLGLVPDLGAGVAPESWPAARVGGRRTPHSLMVLRFERRILYHPPWGRSSQSLVRCYQGPSGCDGILRIALRWKMTGL